MKTFLILFLLFGLSAYAQQTFNCNPTCAHGTCRPGNSCGCDSGWAGKLCDIPVCSPACIHGSCSAPNVCTCSDGYDGALCENYNCLKYGCVRGTCESASNCVCETGWTNSSCNIAICNPGCENGGNCYAPDKCDCSTTNGWSGEYCQNPICNATTGICQHGSTCVGAGVCSCATAPGWTGRLCEDDVNECLKKNFTACDKLTKCTNTKGSYLCSPCPTGYKGDGKTGCVPSCPYGCSNGGLCSSPGTCNCTGTGYTGSQCFIDLDECAVGGYCDPLVTCINTVGSFQCIGPCPTNYTGSPYMSRGGCSPQCPEGCAEGSTCIKPGVCSLANQIIFSLIPIIIATIFLL